MEIKTRFGVLNMNWKLILMRLLLNGVAIALTSLLLPGIRIIHNQIITYLILGAVFGLLNAFVKPIVQFLTLSFLFVTYGLVIVIINTVMLLLLELFMSDLLVIDSFWWALLGGLVLGILGLFLEAIFGLTPPLIDDAPSMANAGER